MDHRNEAVGAPGEVRIKKSDKEWVEVMDEVIKYQGFGPKRYLFKGMEHRKEAVGASERVLITEDNKKWIEVMNEVMKYQGFDPRRLVLALYKKQQDFHNMVLADENILWTRDCKYKIGDNIYEETLSNDWNVDKDVHFLCMVFNSRATPFDMMSKKSAENINKLIDHLKGKYDIVTRYGRRCTTLEPESITISRISAAFPTIIGDLFHMGYGRPLVDPGEIIGPDIEWPRVMFCPNVAACMVKPVPEIQLLAVSVAADDLLHPLDGKTPLLQLKQYLDNAINSNLISEKFKLVKLKEWGVYDEGSYKPSISNSGGVCREFIRRRRADDPYFALNKILG